MYCVYCGTKLQDDMKFCTACGQPCEPLEEDYSELPAEPAVAEIPDMPTVPAFSEPPAKPAVAETPEAPTAPAFSQPTAETAPPLMKTANTEPAFSKPPAKPAVAETPEAPTAPAFSQQTAETAPPLINTSNVQPTFPKPTAGSMGIEGYESRTNKGLLITLVVACGVLVLLVITALIVWLYPSQTVSSSSQSQPTDNQLQPIETTEAPTSATEATLPIDTVATTVPTDPPVSYDNLVTDAYAKEVTYRDYTGQDATATYHIPQIHLESDAITQLNQEIYNHLHPIIQTDLNTLNEQIGSNLYYSITYRWHVNNGILSLVIDYRGAEHYALNYSSCYNIDINSQTIATTDAVVKASGLTESEYRKKVKQALGSNFWTHHNTAEENFYNEFFVDFFNEQLDRTLSDENIDAATPYFNENNQLCILGTRYNIAGSESITVDINLCEFELLPNYNSHAELKTK